LTFVLVADAPSTSIDLWLDDFLDWPGVAVIPMTTVSSLVLSTLSQAEIANMNRPIRSRLIFLMAISPLAENIMAYIEIHDPYGHLEKSMDQ